MPSIWIPPQLKEAADQIHSNGSTKMVRVRDLLAWFEAQRRGVFVVREIRSALKKCKLLTVPDFEVAYIDQRVKLKAVSPPVKTADVTEKVVEERGLGTIDAHAAVVGGSVSDPAPRIGMLQA